MSLENLPCDILLEILKRADHESYVNMALTSKKIHSCLEHGKFDIAEEVKIMGVLTDRIKAKIRGKGPLKNKVEELKEINRISRDPKYFGQLLKSGIRPNEAVQLFALTRWKMYAGRNFTTMLQVGIVPSEQVQLTAINVAVHPRLIFDRLLSTKIIPSEAVQLAAMKRYKCAHQSIIRAGIIPSEEVQLEAVKQNPLIFNRLLEAGIVPSEKVRAEANL